MIENLFIKAKQRADWSFKPASDVELWLPQDLQWYFGHAGEAIIGDRFHDGEKIWFFKILSPSQIEPISKVMNPYQVSQEIVQSSEATYLSRIIISPDSINDIAMAIGGKFSGSCFLLERDSLVPPMRMSMVSNSFCELIERLLKITESETDKVSDELTTWFAEAPTQILQSQM